VLIIIGLLQMLLDFVSCKFSMGNEQCEHTHMYSYAFMASSHGFDMSKNNVHYLAHRTNNGEDFRETPG
jgi:hypothetical protein